MLIFQEKGEKIEKLKKKPKKRKPALYLKIRDFLTYI